LRTSGRWIAIGVVLACAASSVIAICLRDEDGVVGDCRDHKVGPPGPPATEAEWLINSVRATGHSIQDLFRAESRDPVWGRAMEAETRRLLSPVLAQTAGLGLTGLCCHRTGCRMVVRVAPELRKDLVRSASGGAGSPFATTLLWAKAGFPARANWINFDPMAAGDSSVTKRAYREAARVAEKILGFDPIREHQLERLRAEESIFMFDRSTRERAVRK
jgi:hypothetical protein